MQRIDPVAGAGIDSVRLRRGGCHGPCPIYEVELRRDGTALWQGEHFVERLGPHRGELDTYDFERLADYIARSGFFDWRPEYRWDVEDYPEFEIEVAGDGATKRVVQYATDEPRDFWTLATLIDGVAAGIEWSRAQSTFEQR